LILHFLDDPEQPMIRNMNCSGGCGWQHLIFLRLDRLRLPAKSADIRAFI
jgi:hypothetical protein